MPSPEVPCEISRRRAIQVLGLGTATFLSDVIPLLSEPSISPSEPTPQKESESLPGIRVFGKFVVLKNVRGVKELVIENLSGTDELLYIRPTGPFTISLSPNGQRMAYGYQEFINGRAWSNAIVFRPDSVPITSRTTEYWVSGNGNPFNFVWSRDSKKLAFINGWGSSGKTTILGFSQDNVHPIELNGSLLGSFSPDNKWFARVLNNKLEIVGLDGNKRSVGNPDLERWTMSEFAWAPNSRQLAFFSSEKVISEPYRGKSRLHLLNLDSGVVDVLTEISLPGLYPAQLLFSPDGERVVFSLRPGERSLTPNTHVAIFNLQTRETAPIDTMELTDTPSVFGFLPPDLVIIEGVSRDREGNFRRRLLWADTSSGQVVRKQESPGALAHVSSRDLLFLDSPLSLSGPPSTQILYAPITNDPKIEGSLIGSTPGIVNLESINTAATLATLRDGDQFEASGSSWFFFNNQRHALDPRIGPYIGAQSGQLPEVFAREIPPGEAITARPGDAVTDSQNRVWYLRGEKKREVPVPSLFMRNTRLDRDPRFRNGPLRAPQWVIDRIPVGASPKSGEWIHFNKKKISYQPHGGIMCVPLGGYGDNSDNQVKTFKDLMADYVSQGGNEAWVPDGTYHAEKNLRTNEIRLGPYNSDETKWRPPLNVTRGSWMMEFLGEINPGTRFIGIGYSLGGYILFNVALAHPDLFAAVITIDSPLKGIRRAFWTPYGDRVVGFIGKDCADYLVELGDDPQTPERVENGCRRLQEHGVKVFPFHNDDDALVREGVASIQSADTVDFQGRPVQLGWRLGHTPIGGPKDVLEIVTGHGQILRDRTVRNQIVRILL